MASGTRSANPRASSTPETTRASTSPLTRRTQGRASYPLQETSFFGAYEVSCRVRAERVKPYASFRWRLTPRTWQVRSGSPASQSHPGARRLGILLADGGIRLATALVNAHKWESIHRSAWNRNSANFAFWAFCEVELRLYGVFGSLARQVYGSRA